MILVALNSSKPLESLCWTIFKSNKSHFLIQGKTCNDLIYTYIAKSARSRQKLKSFGYLSDQKKIKPKV